MAYIILRAEHEVNKRAVGFGKTSANGQKHSFDQKQIMILFQPMGLSHLLHARAHLKLDRS